MSASISQLIPELQPFASDLVRAAGAAGLQPRVTSTRRSTQEQTRLYRRYQQGLNPYPVAPPGTSAHEFGYAFDMVVSPMDAITDVGAYWEQQGGVWGGEFSDPIHFEYPGFSAPREKSLGYEVATGVASLFVPTPAYAGLTIAKWLEGVPWYYKTMLFGAIPGFENMLELGIENLPQWARDIVTF